ncbi:hypothetical protein [Shewanella surugensis]|uniref:Uncharacterized protein n=1 Tax=Shewanella surugensis TaxID=212020 RepID=A0ABT0LG02_9GAMM|nr:hypothetical protein [Shewanella surugensis]MCL1126489.1 hypothetical protein [Shewanella surugensis]
MNKFILYVFYSVILLASSFAFSTDGWIPSAKLSFVRTMSQTTVQPPGSFEVGIVGGFTLPNGVSCETGIITTLGSVESSDEMYELLVTAFIHDRSVDLGITDDLARSAFPGRCSLTFVGIH